LWFNRSAVFFGSTATRADRADETINLISNEIHQLAEIGPTAEELAKTKAYLNSSFVLNLDTSDKVAALLVQLQLDRQPINYIEHRKQMIDAVTLADAKRVAKRLLDGGLLFTEVGRPSALANASAPSAGAGGPRPALMPSGGMGAGAGEVH
jgi:zinc protease